MFGFENMEYEDDDFTGRHRQGHHYFETDTIRPGIVRDMCGRFNSAMSDNNCEKNNRKSLSRGTKRPNQIRPKKKTFKTKSHKFCSNNPGPFVQFYSTDEDVEINSSISSIDTDRCENLLRYIYGVCDKRSTIQHNCHECCHESYQRNNCCANNHQIEPQNSDFCANNNCHHSFDDEYSFCSSECGSSQRIPFPNQRSISKPSTNICQQHSHTAIQIGRQCRDVKTGSESECHRVIQRKRVPRSGRGAGFNLRCNNNKPVSTMKKDNKPCGKVNAMIKLQNRGQGCHTNEEDTARNLPNSDITPSASLHNKVVTIGGRARASSGELECDEKALVTIGNRRQNQPLKFTLYDPYDEEDFRDIERSYSHTGNATTRELPITATIQNEQTKQPRLISHEAKIENLEFNELRKNRDTIQELRHKVVFKSHSSFWKNIADLLPASSNTDVQVVTSTQAQPREQPREVTTNDIRRGNDERNSTDKKIGSNTNVTTPNPRASGRPHTSQIPIVSVKSSGDIVMASYDLDSSLQLRVQEWTFESGYRDCNKIFHNSTSNK